MRLQRQPPRPLTRPGRPPTPPAPAAGRPAEPNAGRGADLGRYAWTQTLHEVTVTVPVPAGTKGKMLDVVMDKQKLRVGLKGQAPILEVRGPAPGGGGRQPAGRWTAAWPGGVLCCVVSPAVADALRWLHGACNPCLPVAGTQVLVGWLACGRRGQWGVWAGPDRLRPAAAGPAVRGDQGGRQHVEPRCGTQRPGTPARGCWPASCAAGSGMAGGCRSRAMPSHPLPAC